MGDKHSKPIDSNTNNKKLDTEKSIPDEKFGILDHAKNEFKLAGLDKKDSDYEGKLAVWTTEILEVFSKQGHSGDSANIVADLFKQLINWGPLSAFTDNPKEWEDVTEEMLNDEQKSAGERIWQNQRSPSVFSTDAGKTWFRMDNDRRPDGSLEVFKTKDHLERGKDEKSTEQTSAKNPDAAAKSKDEAAHNEGSRGVQKKSAVGKGPRGDKHSDKQAEAPLPKDPKTQAGEEGTESEPA